MKKTLSIISAIVALSSVTVTTQAYSASESECAIWLCLPAGFPSGCSSAKHAMYKRLKKRKSPLPSFSSCAVESPNGGNSKFTYTYKRVLKMEVKKCVRWEKDDENEQYCAEHVVTGYEWKDGWSCYTGSGDDREEIDGCVGVYRQIEIFEDGKKVGETYRW